MEIGKLLIFCYTLFMTIQQFKNDAKNRLEKTSPSAQLDCEVLLCHILECNKTFLLLHAKDELTGSQLEWLNLAVEKRQTGLPIAYITGHKEFFGFDFLVTPDVLIPKPDTEILVEEALKLITKNDYYSQSRKIIDMCSGSGCIGISVIKALIESYNFTPENLPMVTFADISEKALEVTKKNAEKLLTDKYPELKNRLTFIQTNLFDKVSDSFDLILTNPPYIPAAMVDDLLKDGRNEPRLALDGDVAPDGSPADSSDGLQIIRELLPQAKNHLLADGVLLMETGEYNMKEAQRLAVESGFAATKIFSDYEGQLRVLRAE